MKETKTQPDKPSSENLNSYKGPRKELLNEVLEITNNLYIVNTFIRSSGTLINNYIERSMFQDNDSILGGYGILWLLDSYKSVVHVLGIIYGYNKVAKDNDANWSTSDWMLSSAIGYLGMSSLIFLGLHESNQILGKVLFFLLQSFYTFKKGQSKDGIRPLLFARIVRWLNISAVEQSDQQKSIASSRKLLTTISELLGSALLTLGSYYFKENPTFIASLGLGAGVVNLVAWFYMYNFNFKNKVMIPDPLMTREQNQIFFKEQSTWFSNIITDVMVSPLNFLKVSKISLTKDKEWDRMKQKNPKELKHSLFEWSFKIVKLISGYSKNTFITAASAYQDFSPFWESFARTLSQGVSLGWILLNNFYKQRSGKKYIISSLDSLVLSATLTFVANLSFLVAETLDSSLILLLLGYQCFVFQQNILILSLIHMFETFGIEDDLCTPLFLSLKFNLSSLFVGVLSRLVPKSIVLSGLVNLLSYTYVRNLKGLAEASEKI